MPVRSYAIDAGVLSLYFAGRSDVKQYFDRILSGSARGYVCEINLAEFTYNFAKMFGWDAAVTKVALVRKSRIETPVVDEALTETAARLKLRFENKFSLADCYLLAMAISLDAAVLTTEEKLNACKEVEVVPIRL